MIQDRSYELSDQNPLHDPRAGKHIHLPEHMELTNDPQAQELFKQRLTEHWLEVSDGQDSELHDDEITPEPAENPVFTSSEEMRAYYERQHQIGKVVNTIVQKLSQNPDTNAILLNETPDLHMTPAPIAPADFRQQDDDAAEYEITKIQSLREQLSTRRWQKLSHITHQLLDSIVVNLHGREHLDNVKYRAIAAGMILAGTNDISRVYHEWLLETVGNELTKKFPDVETEQIEETCRVLLLQEVDADLHA